MKNIWATIKKFRNIVENDWETFADIYDMNEKFENNKGNNIREVCGTFEVYLKK